MERKRLVADRFRRIWHIVEDIAETPGKSRRELADKFHLSERQVQADLNIIRTDMRLPLVRRQGYRFIAEGVPGGGEGCFDLREAQLLVMILRQAMKDRSIPSDRLGSLMRKLPAMFPAHLQPLVQRTLEAVTASRLNIMVLLRCLHSPIRYQELRYGSSSSGRTIGSGIGDDMSPGG